jgi:hypothetical protein
MSITFVAYKKKWLPLVGDMIELTGNTHPLDGILA